MKTWLFKPFVFIAGFPALFLGITIMLLSALVCSFSHTHFDGVLDAHIGKQVQGYIYFIEPFIDWLCLWIPLFIAGKLFSASSIRLIDVAGTLALARAPMLAIAFIGFCPIPEIKNSQDAITILQNNPGAFIPLIIIGIISIPFILWTIVLMYNAYSISVNLKVSKPPGHLLGCLIIAEVLSKGLLFQLV